MINKKNELKVVSFVNEENSLKRFEREKREEQEYFDSYQVIEPKKSKIRLFFNKKTIIVLASGIVIGLSLPKGVEHLKDGVAKIIEMDNERFGKEVEGWKTEVNKLTGKSLDEVVNGHEYEQQRQEEISEAKKQGK